MTEQEMLPIIKAGEDSYTEFKSEKVHNDSLAKEIVAFANIAGGSIFIGIEDDGNITGVAEKNIEEKVVQICRNSIQPSIVPIVVKHYIQNKLIIEIKIDKGIHRPYKVKTTNKYYIRVGSVSTEPTQEELVRLFQSGGILHFELVSLNGKGKELLDILRFRDYCENYRKTEFPDETGIDTFLENLQILDSQKNLTLLGGLFFGRNMQWLLPQSGIQLARFEGLDKTGNILDHRDLYASIPECIDSALKFVNENSKIKGVFKEGNIRRLDIPEFDLQIIKELLSNAFCHRDWSIWGQQIRLFMFEDRLEIFSPGGLPNTLTLQKALSGISYYRNPAITQICKDYGFVEKAGRGLEKITRKCKLEGIESPVFECDLQYVKVTIKRRKSL